MADTGYKYPTTVLNPGTWTDPDNIKLDDGNCATKVFSNTRYKEIDGEDFGFEIPEDATIDYIQVEVKGFTASGNVDYYIELTAGEGYAYSEGILTTTNEYVILNDFDCDSFSVAEINAGFLVAFSEPNLITDTISIDAIRVKIFYIEAGGSEIKSWDSVAKASIKKVDDLAIASVKKINNLA